MKELSRIGYDGWGLWNKTFSGMGAPKESARRNREFIHKLGF